MNQLIGAIILFILLAVFSLISYKRKSLDWEGVLVGNVVGILSFVWGGLEAFFLLIFFFVVGDIATRYARRKREKEHERRGTANILGNTGASMIAIAFGSPVGFFGGISSALSDTLSSEIGMLSKKKPILISNFKIVSTGTDGGISMLGLITALFGAALVAAIHFFLHYSLIAATIIWIAGFIGCLMDSYLGAIFERKKILENTGVNFLSSAFAVILAHFLIRFLVP